MNFFSWLHELGETEGFAFLVIGGHAVNAHGYERLTQDLDLLIKKGDAEKWLAAATREGYTVERAPGDFMQLSSSKKELPPLDFMLVNEATFLQMMAAAQDFQIQSVPFLMPSLDHLLALKIHALKHGPPQRGYKDFMDVLGLTYANQINVRDDKFRLLCDKYGDAAIYEQIVAFEERERNRGARG